MPSTSLNSLAAATSFGPWSNRALLISRILNHISLMSSSSHAPTLLTNVVMPALMYNDEDAQMWLEDPQEYVSKLYRTLDDLFTAFLCHFVFLISHRSLRLAHRCESAMM